MARRLSERPGSARGTLRGRPEVARFFAGLEVAEPGVVQPQRWRRPGPVAEDDVMLWSGLARKP